MESSYFVHCAGAPRFQERSIYSSLFPRVRARTASTHKFSFRTMAPRDTGEDIDSLCALLQPASARTLAQVAAAVSEPNPTTFGKKSQQHGENSISLPLSVRLHG